MINIKLPLRVIPKKRPIVTKYGTRMPEAYKAQKQLLQLKLRGFNKLHGEIEMDCLFIFKKAKSNAKNKYSMPVGDVDNLIGAIMDACEGVLYENDRMVTEIASKKMWGEEDLVFITLKEIKR